jgi:hypothetical protein
MATPAGGKLGKENAAPAMDKLHSKENIAAFAEQVRTQYGNDPERAMKEFKFGTFAEKGDLSLDSNQKVLYLKDVAAVGDHVKTLWVKTMVDNYFREKPLAVKFSVGGTATPGGDLVVGELTEASSGETYLSVRVLCHIAPVT